MSMLLSWEARGCVCMSLHFTVALSTMQPTYDWLSHLHDLSPHFFSAAAGVVSAAV